MMEMDVTKTSMDSICCPSYLLNLDLFVAGKFHMLLACTLYGKLNCEPSIELLYANLSSGE